MNVKYRIIQRVKNNTTTFVVEKLSRRRTVSEIAEEGFPIYYVESTEFLGEFKYLDQARRCLDDDLGKLDYVIVFEYEVKP